MGSCHKEEWGLYLSDEQKACRQRISEQFLHRYQTEGEEFPKRILALDETWIRDFEPELKSQSSQWKHTDSLSEVTRVIRQLNSEGVLSRIQDLPKCWEAVIRRNGDY